MSIVQFVPIRRTNPRPHDPVREARDPIGVGDDHRIARLEDADDRVGGAEVNADGLRRMTPPGCWWTKVERAIGNLERAERWIETNGSAQEFLGQRDQFVPGIGRVRRVADEGHDNLCRTYEYGDLERAVVGIEEGERLVADPGDRDRGWP